MSYESSNYRTDFGSLDIVSAFLNTIDNLTSVDLISTTAGLASWLTERSFLGPDDATSITEVSRAVEFREALRPVVGANSGNAVPSSAIEAVNRAARLSGVQFRLSDSGSGAGLVSSLGGLDAAIASILSGVYAAMAAGTWSRVKTCGNPDCRRAFYDHSRNRSGVWCEMATCGNRMKARRYRLRRSRESQRSWPPGGTPGPSHGLPGSKS